MQGAYAQPGADKLDRTTKFTPFVELNAFVIRIESEIVFIKLFLKS